MMYRRCQLERDFKGMTINVFIDIKVPIDVQGLSVVDLPVNPSVRGKLRE